MAQNISIKEAARILGKSEQFIRIGLQKGILPFGTAVKTSSIYSYHISPKLFYEYIGNPLTWKDANIDGNKGGD